MTWTKLILLGLLAALAAVPGLGWTYKSTYAQPCGAIWPAVQDVLGNPDNYDVKTKDDGKMHAEYQVRHQVHANVSGAVLQRTNKVTLVTKGAGCEMQVVSNYSGWEHNDREDFKKRVDEALLKLKAPAVAKPEEIAKPQ